MARSRAETTSARWPMAASGLLLTTTSPARCPPRCRQSLRRSRPISRTGRSSRPRRARRNRSAARAGRMPRPELRRCPGRGWPASPRARRRRGRCCPPCLRRSGASGRRLRVKLELNGIYGLIQPDEGEIRLDGKAVTIRSPKDAIAARIGMVHQHFMLVPVFTVAENVTLGLERTRRLGLLDRRQARRDVRELSERYGLDVNPDAIVEELPVGVQQRVEIIKALLREATVLVLDEPTSVLTPGETDDLFRIMRELRAGGRSIVFISHKLREVQAIADTITVIRRGKVVGERPPTATDAELAALMVGRAVQLRVSKEPAQPGEVVLDVRGLTVAGEQDKPAVDDVSFEVRAGEILGVAGVQGNGQTELCEALIGLRPAAAGSVLVDGRDISHEAPRERLRAGIGYIPEDRQEDGLGGDFSGAHDLVLDVYY